MNILTIIRTLIKNRKIAAKAILTLSVAFLLIWGITLNKKNKMLTESLEMAQNNIEAYQGSLQGSWQANNVLKLDMTKLSQQNDSLIKEIDKVRKEKKIKSSNLNSAATQTQVIYVNNSKGVRGDIVTILKDTTYTDTMQYNDLTKVSYSIGKDSVKIGLDIKNTQYLFTYKTREYKNKKNFFKRLITFDWKKVTKYRYEIVNTNDLLKTSDVRIIEK